MFYNIDTSVIHTGRNGQPPQIQPAKGFGW